MRTIAPLLFVLTLFAGVCSAQDEDTIPDAGQIQIRVTHRVFTSFVDTLVVEIGENFWVGDTEYSAEVRRFNPDFGIKEGEGVIERSEVAHNPAFQIHVFEEEEQVDEVWAFLGSDAPHYRRDSLLGFQVLSFSWRGELLVNPVLREGE